MFKSTSRYIFRSRIVGFLGMCMFPSWSPKWLQQMTLSSAAHGVLIAPHPTTHICRHLHAAILTSMKFYHNVLIFIPLIIVGRQFPKDSCVSAPLVSRGHGSFCSRLSSQGCLYSEQSWTTEVLFPARVQGGFVYCPVK